MKFGTAWSPGCFDGSTAFRNMQVAFEEAMARCLGDLHESFYTFAGQTARIRVVGRELAEHIYRPFSHLKTHESAAGSPELRIDLWDENITENGCRLGPTHNGGRWNETTLQSSDGRIIGQQLPNMVSCLDREAKHIVGSIGWHDRIFIYERAKPLARLLLEWHADQDVPIIHTGLVARDSKGVLFAGKSGSGKSTTALACLCAGFDFLGEDYVGLQRRQDGSFVGHSLYNSVFAETHHLARFTDLNSCTIKGRFPYEKKSVVVLSQQFPERLRRAVPIRALALLRVGDAPKAKFRPASKGEALLALGPSSLLQIPNRTLGARGFARLAQLVDRVPCYSVEVGIDLASVAHCVDELLAQVDR